MGTVSTPTPDASLILLVLGDLCPTRRRDMRETACQQVLFEIPTKGRKTLGKNRHLAENLQEWLHRTSWERRHETTI